jgi:D-arabinose 1-dehydrogenase-like Zn-dependent alcohol dehydrogenase
MLAAALKDFNQLALENVPKPGPGPGEVLVRIKSCGVCEPQPSQERDEA